MLSQTTLRALGSSALRRSGTAPRRAFTATVLRCEHFLDADVKTFEKAIASKDKVVLVDFYADWCHPCKMLSPILEKMTLDASVKSGSGRPLDLVTIDTDAQVELAQKFGIRSLPTVIAFKDGEQVGQFMGAMPEGSVKNFLTKV